MSNFMEYQIQAEVSAQEGRAEKAETCPHCPVKGADEILENEAGGMRPYKSFWHEVNGQLVECVYGPEYWEGEIKRWAREQTP